MVYCCFVGFTQGDLNKIIAPVDRDYRFCGIKHESSPGVVEYDYSAYPYLYFPRFQPDKATSFSGDNGIMKSAFCVKQCPGENRANVECPAGKLVKKDAETYCDAKGKGINTYKTRTILKFCIPKDNLETTLQKVWTDMLLTLKGGKIG